MCCVGAMLLRMPDVDVVALRPMLTGPPEGASMNIIGENKSC